MSQTSNNPTLKGRLMTLQLQSKQLKNNLQLNQSQIKNVISQIQQGTQSKVLQDKISYIKDLLNEKLNRIDYKIKKHIHQQKQKNNQLLEMIGIVKADKNQLQRLLQNLQQKINQLQVKIGNQVSYT